eukprot:357499-Chlamydomonas_euryale.AAC.13
MHRLSVLTLLNCSGRNRRTAPGISAAPSESNLRYFNVMILGPQQSPYEGKEAVQMPTAQCGTFKLELFLPEDYPMAPPKVRTCFAV